MFDKTFFKFALGFTAIVLLGMGVLYFAGYVQNQNNLDQTASAH